MSGSHKIGLKTYLGNPHDTNGDALLDRDELTELVKNDKTSDATLKYFNQAVSLGQSEYDVMKTFLSLGYIDYGKFYINSSSNERTTFLNMARRWSPGLVDELRKESQYHDTGDASETHDIPEELQQLEDLGARITFDKDVYTITGNNLPLPNGATLQDGEIRYTSDGMWFVAGGRSAQINGVSIEPHTAPTAIFFEGDHSYENVDHVVIDVNQKMVKVRGVTEWSRISFHDGNPFTPTNNGDKLSIETISGDGVLIQARDDDDLIPRIEVGGGAMTTIEIGSNNFRALGDSDAYSKDSKEADVSFYKSGEFASNRDGFTEVPVEIVVTNDKGDPVPLKARGAFDDSNLGTGMSIICNNYGQVGFKTEDNSIVPFKGFPPHEAALRPDQNGKITIDDFNEYCASRGAPHIRYTGIADPTRIKQAIDYLDTLSTGMLHSLKGVDFPDPAVFNEGKKKAAYATPDGVIHFKKGLLDLPTFHHECAHIHHMHIQRTGGDSFDSKWISLGGDIYGKYVREWKDSDDDNISYLWHDAPKYDDKRLMTLGGFDYHNEYVEKYAMSARYGCVRPYGAAKPYDEEDAKTYEDVATYVEQFWRDPAFFEPLIDSDHPDYDPKWGSIYAGKLKLLIAEGFIPIERVPAWMSTVLYS